MRRTSRSHTRPPYLRQTYWPIWSGALALFLLLATHAVARAHAVLVSAQPAPDSVLASSPARIRLEFSEPVDPTLATLAVVGSDGQRVELRLAADPRDPRALVAVSPILPADRYHVIWRVVADDGHPSSGSYVFTISGTTGPGAAAAPSAATTPTTTSPAAQVAPPSVTWGPTAFGAPLVPAVLRGLGVGCSRTVAGLLVFVVWMNAGVRSRPARVAFAFSVAAFLLLTAHLFAWLLVASPTHSLKGPWLSAALTRGAGRTELWRAGLALAPLIALWLGGRADVALALAIPTLLASAAAGHTATNHPAWAIPLKALHLSAVSAWLGGLLWLVVREHDTPVRLARDGERVSTVALSCVIVVFLSGVAQAALMLHSTTDFTTAYGIVVLGKVLGLVFLLAFGAWHRFRLLPRLAARADQVSAAALQRSVVREIQLMWLVVLLGGFLAYLSPPPPRSRHALPTHAGRMVSPSLAGTPAEQ